MAKQYGFYYDAGRCIQCRTCELACKGTRGLESGVKWRRVVETWDGEYPDVTRTFFSLACMHCDKPACVAVCPTGAIKKRPDSIVFIDQSLCNGCQECAKICPYNAIGFHPHNHWAEICDLCVKRLDKGLSPFCVQYCMSRALFFGTEDEFQQRKNASHGAKI